MMTMASSGEEETDWSPARLIPATGIRGAKEQEERATSALLAVMQVVPSFGKTLLSYMGAPGGKITTFVEPRFHADDGGTVIPDGAIVLTLGGRKWVGLVEVKTGSSPIDGEQVGRYLRVARQHGFGGLLTISNQIVASPEESPARVNGRRIRVPKGLALRHLSWFRILTEAVIQYEHRGVKDSEQGRILGELISFLDDDRSGAVGFEGMGRSWVTVRDAARKRILGTSDSEVKDVAKGWEGFLEYLSLRLRQDLGRPVSPVYQRGLDQSERQRSYVASLGDDGRLKGIIRVTDAVAPIWIEADLAALQTTTRIRFSAPGEGYPKTRINWLLRQLKDVPEDLRIEVRFPRGRHDMSELVSVARSNPSLLLYPGDRKRHPTKLDVALTRDMGTKGGKGRGSFVAETMNQVAELYRRVVQDIHKWAPRALRLSSEPQTRSTASTDASPPDDAAEIVEAIPDSAAQDTHGDPWRTDTDDDGLPDAAEILDYGTDRAI